MTQDTRSAWIQTDHGDQTMNRPIVAVVAATRANARKATRKEYNERLLMRCTLAKEMRTAQFSMRNRYSKAGRLLT